MSTISLRLNNRDDELIKKYAKMKNISVSKLIRDAVIEKIEEELDVSCLIERLPKLSEPTPLMK